MSPFIRRAFSQRQTDTPPAVRTLKYPVLKPTFTLFPDVCTSQILWINVYWIMRVYIRNTMPLLATVVSLCIVVSFIAVLVITGALGQRRRPPRSWRSEQFIQIYDVERCLSCSVEESFKNTFTFEYRCLSLPKYNGIFFCPKIHFWQNVCEDTISSCYVNKLLTDRQTDKRWLTSLAEVT